jgi:hypothetical protein
MCVGVEGDTEARRASPETCLEARVMIALIQQTAQTMDQLESSATDTESRVAAQTGDADAERSAGGGAVGKLLLWRV